MAVNLIQIIGSAFRSLKFGGWKTPRVQVYRDLQSWNSDPFTLTDDDYLSIPSVFAAIRLISESIASLPIHLYKKSGADGRSRDNDHPSSLLFARPNPFTNSLSFREMLVRDAIVYGAGYAHIKRDGMGNPWQLYHIPAHYVTPDIGLDGESPVYRVSAGFFDEATVLADCDVFVLRGYMGQGLAKACEGSLELTSAAETYATKVFQNGARPGGILSHPARLSDDARLRLRKSWEALHGGVDKSFSTAILEEGMQWVPVSSNANDQQLDQLRNFQIIEVCRIFGIPASKLKVQGGGYATSEQESLAFVQDCLRPWAIRVEQEANRKFLLAAETDHYFESNFEGMLRGDTIARFKAYSIARNWSILSPNEIRKMENYPPVPGGDVLLSPVNMAPLNPGGLQAAGANAPAGDMVDAIDAEDAFIPQEQAQPGQVAQPQADTTPATDQQPQQDVQAAALNGAQVTALVDLALKVAGGLLPKPAAIAIAKAAFPLVGDATIAAIFGNIKELTPEEMAAGNAAASGKAPPAPAADTPEPTTLSGGSGAGDK